MVRSDEDDVDRLVREYWPMLQPGAFREMRTLETYLDFHMLRAVPGVFPLRD